MYIKAQHAVLAAAIALSPAVAISQPGGAATDTVKPAIAAYGEVRTRSEWDRPMTSAPSDFFTLMRSRLGVRIVPSSSARIVMEMQDSRVLGDATANARQSFNLHQGYLELSSPTRAGSLRLRAGRQEIALANERLVGALGWTNFGRAFDGLRVALTPNDNSTAWSVDAFAATIEERGRHFGPNRSVPTTDQSLGGVFVTRALNRTGTARLELTGLLDAGTGYRSYHDARRNTLDMRLRHANLRGVRFEIEGAMQRGRQHVVIDSVHHDQDVGSWLAGVRIGNAVNASSAIGVTLGADLLSGDENGRDARYSAFNTLYGTNHPFYGLIDLFLDPAGVTRERGLQDAFVQTDVRISDQVRIHGQLHRMGLATGVNRDLGWEADVVIPVKMSSLAQVDIGYSAFRAGSGAEQIGLGQRGHVQQWAYVQLRAFFQR